LFRSVRNVTCFGKDRYCDCAQGKPNENIHSCSAKPVNKRISVATKKTIAKTVKPVGKQVLAMDFYHQHLSPPARNEAVHFRFALDCAGVFA
jgi:hypothetical protein